jgi:NAD(P)H-hydrate repair Nnr-like enzyme with NAD(P)H-hydrate epimerase domain
MKTKKIQRYNYHFALYRDVQIVIEANNFKDAKRIIDASFGTPFLKAIKYEFKDTITPP